MKRHEKAPFLYTTLSGHTTAHMEDMMPKAVPRWYCEKRSQMIDWPMGITTASEAPMKSLKTKWAAKEELHEAIKVKLPHKMQPTDSKSLGLQL